MLDGLLQLSLGDHPAVAQDPSQYRQRCTPVKLDILGYHRPADSSLMPEPIAPYHERLPDLERELAERGCVGVLVLDASSLSRIEDEYGGEAYEEVRQRFFKILEEARGKDYRAGDILCLDQPGSLRFLFLLDRKRRRNLPLTIADLKTARDRMVASLVPNLSGAAFPYIKRSPRRSAVWLPAMLGSTRTFRLVHHELLPDLKVGHGLCIHNPLLHIGRMVERALKEALDQATHLRQSEDFLILERLEDILLRERIRTDYQAIRRMREGTVMGFEALSRGPRGSGLESASALFDAADEHDLRVELDRLCRRRALLSSGRIPSNTMLFINTLPATMRDPQFRGKALIDFLEKAQVLPGRIVIEITEELVITNYEPVRETMRYFTDLGMSFAVDDVGAGYSGLEAIAKLKPNYLKIDIGLVRDVHAIMVNQAIVKAIIDLGHGIGAHVIAEGIEKEGEAETLQELGVDFGQGYYFDRPDAGPEPS
jgi:EAL domain-containing protein (putative c-di-GMP-specific phosphodiesterase class I)